MSTIAVIGLGQLGAAVATYLGERGADVIAVDSDETRVEAIKDKVTQALCLNATDERALRAAGLAECGTVVLALGEGQLEEAVLATMLLRELGVGRIISRAGTDLQGKVLERLGVSKVVFPERQIGIQIARQILTPTVQQLAPLSGGACLAEVEVPPGAVGRTLGELQLRRAYGLNAVALRRRHPSVSDDGSLATEENVDNLLGAGTTLQAGDVLVVVGSDESVRAFAART